MVLDKQRMQETHVWSLMSKPAHVAHNNIAALDTLQQDMLSALEHDQQKKQVNDAKLRAVAQRVEYDDFEKLVAGAHLKPIKPRSQVQADIGKAFDAFVMPKIEPTAALPTALPTFPAAAKPPDTPPVPTSSNEFVRVWRRQCKTNAQKYAYLVQIEPETLPMLFRTELDAAIFDGIVSAILERVLGGAAANDAPAAGTSEAAAAGSANARWAADFLQGIVRVNRFELTLDFADAATTKSLVTLFDAWQADGPLGAEDLATLRAKYRVPAADGQ